jgi:hypothetical protein
LTGRLIGGPPASTIRAALMAAVQHQQARDRDERRGQSVQAERFQRVFG